ncbi:MAG: glycosyltransferase family 2 protein [Desulfobacterales bacterium]|nr:glycosyltransferase family 2 protein [Desulfobacterales bacterium]
MLHKIFRICDLRDGRTKISHITKRQCFENFVAVFGTDNLTVVADNCRPETVEYLRGLTDQIHQAALGNAASFLYALKLAGNLPQDDAVYLVEDDYLHQAGAETFLEEGLERADYVSLYDHPDKYADPSPNPLVKDGAETCRVLMTRSTHWKQTNSTTMTFAARVRTLREDAAIMGPYCRAAVPADFFMFRDLLKRGRTLITPIPGRATHCDHYPTPFIFDGPIPEVETRDAGAIGGTAAAPVQTAKGAVRLGNAPGGRFRAPVPVIIPFFKRQDQLNQCLAALKGQTWPVEIFVRDNTDDNVYFTAAINEGLTRFLDRPVDYLLMLNQDMYLAPDAVERMVAFMDAHPRCGIGAPLQLDATNSQTVIWAGGFEAFPAGRHQVGNVADLDHDAPILWANGACMILRKTMVRQIGLLDPAMVFIGSDSDYSFTARSRGWEVWRIASARGVHEHGASGKISDLGIEAIKLDDLIHFGRKWLTGGLYQTLAHGKDPSAEQAGAIVTQAEQARGWLKRYMAEGRCAEEVVDGGRLRRPEELAPVTAAKGTLP